MHTNLALSEDLLTSSEDIIDYSRTLSNRINSLHKRAFWVVCNDFKSSFHQLLEKDNSVTIHQRNLKVLAIEVYKVHNNITSEIMKDAFKIKNHQYDFRRYVRLQRRNLNTVLYGSCYFKRSNLEFST